MNIAEDYVSFEIAKLLKEKGFDEKVSTHYLVHPSGFPEFFDKKDEFPDPEDVWLKCPTHQMAMKWLREVHNIFYVVYPKRTDNKIVWKIDICNLIIDSQRWYLKNEFDIYEEAVEAAIKYILENLI